MPNRLGVLAALLGLLLAAGSGCDDPVPPRLGADIGTPMDAGTSDDAAVDAAASGSDAASDGGGGSLDGGDAPADCLTFVMGAPVVRATTFVSADDAPALAVRDDGALVGWIGGVDGQPRLSMQWLPLDGDLASVSGVTDGEGSEQRDPAIVATGSGYVVVWRDDRDGDLEVLARAVDTEGLAQGSVLSLSDNDVEDGPPAIGLDASGGVVVTWVQDPDGTPQGRVARLTSDGSLEATSELDALSRARTTATVAPLPGGSLVGWVDGDTGSIRLQALAMDGSPRGEAATVAAEGRAFGAVDAQPRLAGAVVAYDVNVGGSRPEVRFQLLDEDGAPSGTEEILSEGAMGATGASIAPLVSGFATAFRADTGSDRVLRLELFEVGEVGLDSVDLGEVDSLSDTRPIVRTSPDDRSVVVAWTDDARLLTALGSCE